MSSHVSHATRIAPSPQLQFAWDLYFSGGFEECIVQLEPYISEDVEVDIRRTALLRKSRCLSELGRYRDALRALLAVAPLVDEAGPQFKSQFFHQRAHVKRKTGDDNGALIDYAEAGFWAEEINDELGQACVRNNIAKLYSEADRLDEAIKESDAAIAIAKQLNDDIHLGRFYDQRAQILVEHKQFSEALVFSRPAARLLANHPALAEARHTHGIALAGLAAEHLTNESDPIATFRGRREAQQILAAPLDEDILRYALELCEGHVAQAAALLGVTHRAVIKAAEHFDLPRQPKQRRTKRVIVK